MMAPAPTPYFDQNGASMYLSNAARAAAMQTVRLVSPAPQMILNASGRNGRNFFLILKVEN